MFNRLRNIIVLVMLLFSIIPAMAQIAMPDTVCLGTTRLYHVNNSAIPSTYIWKIDGVTQTISTNEMSITWNTAGTFLLTVQEHSANGCIGDIRSGLVYVKPFPLADAGPDAIICFGTTTRLNGNGGTIYQWTPSGYLSNPSISNPMVNAPVAGVFTYLLDVTDAFGCKSLKKDTVVVTIRPPVRIFAGNDTSISVNQRLQLNAVDISNSGFVNYLWSPSFGLSNTSVNNPVAVFTSISINNGITYIVTASTADGCVAKDDINVKIFLISDLYVPTGFTPNGDGLNDYAKVIPAGIKELKYFSIYSRWGELVFTTTDATKGWNGKWKGIDQPDDVFVWMASAVDYKGNLINKKGTITLIR